MSQGPLSGKLVVDSVQSLLSALGWDRRVMGPVAESVSVRIDEGAGGQRGDFQKCHDCIDVFAALAFNDTVISLELVCAPDELCLAIAKALKHNTTLQVFKAFAVNPHSVFATRMSNETVLAMAESLQCNSTLESFTLRAGYTDMGDEVGLALAAALRSNTGLRAFTLDASNTAMGDGAGLALAAALESNTGLWAFTLEASDTDMGDGAGLALAASLKCSTGLRSFTLDVSRTRIGGGTGLAVAEALRSHAGLQALTLSVNDTPIGEEAGVALGRALQSNLQLRAFTLDAIGADMGDGGAGLALAAALKSNAALEAFSLSVTEVDDETLAAVADALEGNPVLLYCEIHSSDFWWSRITEYTERNREVQAHRHALTGLARCSGDASFESLVETPFRRKILGFFLPPRCRLLPIDFVRVGAPAPGRTPSS